MIIFLPGDEMMQSLTKKLWISFGFFLKFHFVYNCSREATPPLNYGDVNPTDEVIHLRRQISKLNRRLLALEIDNMQRQHREKIVCCIGLAYFLMKTVMWLNRN